MSPIGHFRHVQTFHSTWPSSCSPAVVKTRTNREISDDHKIEGSLDTDRAHTCSSLIVLDGSQGDVTVEHVSSRSLAAGRGSSGGKERKRKKKKKKKRNKRSGSSCPRLFGALAAWGQSANVVARTLSISRAFTNGSSPSTPPLLTKFPSRRHAPRFSLEIPRVLGLLPLLPPLLRLVANKPGCQR